ncbi:MAG: methyltransferase protein [Acidobacteria bacterium]|nr:methyltransferase protein [Acidobacteriota bacterium]
MRVLYLAANGRQGVVDEPRLDLTTERHKIDLAPECADSLTDALTALDADAALGGAVIEMYHGWAGRDVIVLARRIIASGRRAWLYWPGEQAIECIDEERLSSLWRHWAFITTYRTIEHARNMVGRLARATQREIRGARQALDHVPLSEFPQRIVRKLGRSLAGPSLARSSQPAVPDAGARLAALDALIASAAPVPFPVRPMVPSSVHPIAGCGAYLRTDFWAQIQSGGSYGHTCYVAKELAAVTARLICFVTQRYRLLDDFGVQQIVLDPPSASASEDDIVNATPHFVRMLRPAFEAMPPAYIYERLCLGNYAGALLSRSLQIPYMVEYNGSEISMRRSFDGVGYVYEEEYIKAEEFAFKQATMISVISEEVRGALIARRVDPAKILVNPNGADLQDYAPAVEGEKARVRAECGLDPGAAVIGFTGTFGGWHGVDVLAAAIPEICRRVPDACFLLIGDGNYKHLVDTQVVAQGLEDRVRRVGRVPQSDGARLLKACDIFVSPHSSHMVDSRFFGSPTKIFEYMAMGGAIVASDLEQIGEALSPALTASDLSAPLPPVVTDQRAVLCVPGDVGDFVEAVVGLLAHRGIWRALGRNSRAAVEQHYSWTGHVANLWLFLSGSPAASFGADLQRRRGVVVAPTAAPTVGVAPVTASAVRQRQVETGDSYKDEVQKQWDNDPAGSHYVKVAEPHTLPWFDEAEAYRYGEYAPWMAETMEFAKHRGEKVLEIGGGMGTDLSQFARNGALITDLDLSAGHLELAKENFRLRGLPGEFVLHDAESLVFGDSTFDLVYSNGVLHHTPNTRQVVEEIYRVLKPGGRAIIMMYAENSLHYWRNLVWAIGLKSGELMRCSMGDIMSRSVERSDNAAARPLVKVYTARRLRNLFRGFTDLEVVQRQMVAAEVPRLLRWVPLPTLGTIMGWNLIIKARKPDGQR